MIVRPFSAKSHSSWLQSGIVIDYMDGIVEALVKCPEGHLALVKMVAWDNEQEVRVFVVFEMPREASSNAEEALGEDERRWPFSFPDWEKNTALGKYADKTVHLSESMVPDYFVVAERLDREFLFSGVLDEKEAWKQVDWQVHLERASANRQG